MSKVDLDLLLAVQSKILTNSNDQILAPGKSYHFAIGFTDDPYYGEIVAGNKDYVIKSKMKDSTTTFYSYVSLYITTKGRRLTLAVLPVKKGVSKVEYIQKFLAFINRHSAGRESKIIIFIGFPQQNENILQILR